MNDEQKEELNRIQAEEINTEKRSLLLDLMAFECNGCPTKVPKLNMSSDINEVRFWVNKLKREEKRENDHEKD